MNIQGLHEIDIHTNLYPLDINGREINIYSLHNVVPQGVNLLYPNTLLLSNGKKLFRPIDETVMSLGDAVNKCNFSSVSEEFTKVIVTPVFFFVYNTDNYYHFVYDTLPYLISFNHLRKEIPELKLLMGYPNEDKSSHYKFVTEFLEILNITEDDILMIDEDTRYDKIYISSTYTYGDDPNKPPREEVYELYRKMVCGEITDTQPKKIYVSRRSWVHGDLSNIGTNYTTRRNLTNEDELVTVLESFGYTEIFTETMTTKEKISMFSNATSVIGAIGGGLCNVLFSGNDCELIPIVSPGFLDINERFLHSFVNTNLKLFIDTSHAESGTLKTHMRVKHNSTIGEIMAIDGSDVTLSFSESPIAGWNNSVNYSTIIVKYSECEQLDNGLNSPWTMDIEKLKHKHLK